MGMYVSWWTDRPTRRMHRMLHRHAPTAVRGLCSYCFRHDCPQYRTAWEALAGAGIMDFDYDL